MRSPTTCSSVPSKPSIGPVHRCIRNAVSRRVLKARTLVKPVSVDSPLQSSTSNTLQSKKQSRKTAGIVAATVADDEAQTSVVQSSKGLRAAKPDGADTATKRPMSEIHRQKISEGLRSKYTEPRSELHKRRISESMQRLYRTSMEARAARSRTQAGRLKTCSHCGQEGHNKRGCPLLTPSSSSPSQPDSSTMNTASAASSSSSADTAKVSYLNNQRCVLCGQHGHNRRTCPQRHAIDNNNSNNTSAAVTNSWAHAMQAAASSSMHDTTSTMTAAGDGDQAHPSSSSSRTASSSAAAVELPPTVQAMVTQAVTSVVAAWNAGVTRQHVELLLPAPPAYNKWNPWPGGVRQQFNTAVPIIEQLLLGIRDAAPQLGGRIMSELVDEVDCVATWQSDKLAAILFPTADSLPLLRQLATTTPTTPTTIPTPPHTDPCPPPRLLLCINAQWAVNGQIVSDFGFGQQKREAERFLESFADVYRIQRVDVMGDEMQLLKAWPHPWHAYLVPQEGGRTPVGGGNAVWGANALGGNGDGRGNSVDSAKSGMKEGYAVDAVGGGVSLSSSSAAAAAAQGLPVAPSASNRVVTQQQGGTQGPRFGAPLLVAKGTQRPGYEQLLEVLKCLPSTRASMTWLDRMMSFRRTITVNHNFDGEHPLLAFTRPPPPPTWGAPGWGDAAPGWGDAALSSASGALGGWGPGGLSMPAVPFVTDGGSRRVGGDVGGGTGGQGMGGGDPAGAANVVAVDQEIHMQEIHADHVDTRHSSTMRVPTGYLHDVYSNDTHLDRFGELDIITGHPVRDLRLDAVRQLAQWTGPIFGGSHAGGNTAAGGSHGATNNRSSSGGDSRETAVRSTREEGGAGKFEG